MCEEKKSTPVPLVFSITGVSGFTHGTGFLDANGFVHYTPDANYNGAANDGGWLCERWAA